MRIKLEVIEKLVDCGRFNHGWSKSDEIYFTGLTNPLPEGFELKEGPINKSDDYSIKGPIGIQRMISIIIEEMELDKEIIIKPKEKEKEKKKGGELIMASKYQVFMKKCMKTGKSMSACAKAWSASPAAKAAKKKKK